MTAPWGRTGQTSVRMHGDDVPAGDIVRVTRLARELRVLNQILSTDVDTFGVQMNGPAPAWTAWADDDASATITVAAAYMPMPNTAADVAIWLGTNGHELGHVLFSPRATSPLWRRIADTRHVPGIAIAFNIAEDQRMERLLLDRFAPWAAYLIAALSHHIHTDDDRSWPLVAGRTWIDPGARAQSRAMFARVMGRNAAAEVARIIGAYQRLIDPGDAQSQQAYDLIVRLAELLASHRPQIPAPCQPSSGGAPEAGMASAGAPATADEDADPQPAQPSPDGEPAAGDGPGDGEPSTSTGEADGDGAGAGAGDGAAGDAPAAPPTMADRMKAQAAEEIRDDSELEAVMDAVAHGRPRASDIGGRRRSGRWSDVPDRARMLHRDVADALTDLRDESEPGWIRRTDAGRLNVRRMALGGRADEMFDRYDPGALDTTELDCMLLVDVSGSMQGDTRALAESIWAIRHAADDIDASLSVVGFSSGDAQLIASPGDRPDDGRMWEPIAGGGTEPTAALVMALDVLTAATSRTRMAVILTDGEWYNAPSAEAIISALNDSGIVTVLAHYGFDDGREINGHGCAHAARITDMGDLARMFRDVARAEMIR